MIRALFVGVLDVLNERLAQIKQWGQQDHPDFHPDTCDRSVLPQEYLGVPDAGEARSRCQILAGLNRLGFSAILVEEVAEAIEAIGNDKALREELVQVAAVAVAWVEAIDRRNVKKD